MIADKALARAFESTWPAAETADSGALRSGRGLGAGGRVSSTHALHSGWSGADLDAAEQIHRGWGQVPMFRVASGDVALNDALRARGYAPENPTAIMAMACDALAGDIPEMTSFAIWPPLEVQRILWAEGNISAARQDVMMRVAGPRTALLGRLDDRVAGCAFVAVDGPVAMLHALEVAPEFRRRGLSGWLARAAAEWAVGQGAQRLGLAVSRANLAARASYDKLGFQEIETYSYWMRPGDGAH